MNDIDANIRLFAGDTSLFIIVETSVAADACINTDLGKIMRWADLWLVAATKLISLNALYK